MLKKFLPALAIIISFVSCSFAYSGGTGLTEDDPYVISTESDLAEFRDNVNDASDTGSYYVLSTDAVGFQMTKYNTWTPVGNTNSFTGHLEGNGKIIYVNMNTDSSIAFFGTIGSGAAVSNLSIEGSVKSNTDAAGFALTLDGGTLTNCRFSGQVYVNDSVPDDPTQNLNAAGLVEYMSSGTIEDCIFNGEIKIDGGIYPRTGGIVALMHGGSIKDCDVSHYSTIESYATEIEVVDDNDVVIPPSAIAGGIAGQVNIGLSETIEGCDFSGKVTAESWNTSYAGGIVGYMRGGTLKDNTVLDDSVISGKYTAGGIVGFLRTGGTVENNTVEAGATITAESYSAGGIIGILDLGTVTNNESHATISGNASYKGGIIGQVTPATESPATRTITGNSYSGADYGIGSDSSGSPSNEGTDETESPFYITTSSALTSGVIYETYSQVFATSVSSDSASWQKTSGDFPSGLTLSGNTLSGTPTETGTFEFTLTASVYNSVNNSYRTAEKTFSLTIDAHLNITTSSALENGTAGRTYGPVTLETDAEDGAYVTWTASGLPAGLTLGNLTGILTGTPTTAGYYSFTVTAQSGAYTAAKTFTITINPSLTIITDSKLPSALVNSEYSVKLSSDASASDNITWLLIHGTLPAGLTLSEAGTISGRPQESGTFSFGVSASIKNTNYTDSKDFTIEVLPSLYIATDSTLPSAKEGSRYEVQLSANIDSDMMITWSVISGDFPNGLTLRENTGVISGIPDTEGTYVFIIHAKAGLLESSKTFTLTVKPALSITTGSELPEARPNELYLLKFETDADSFDVVEWQFISGDLPEGFTFRKETGILSGSSSQNGVYEFTIGADVKTASRNLSARKIFVLRLSPAMIITNNNSYTANAGSSFSLKLETLIPDTASKESSVWSVISGDIPLGLKLNEDGTLSGIPTRAGTFRFTLQALSGYSRARKDFTFRINLAISSPSYLTDGIKGESYSELLRAEGSSNITWSLVKGNTLPSGLTLSEAGLIQGIPTTEGIYDFTVNASDDNGNGARKLLRITIGSSALIPITTSSLTSGTAGEAYYAVLYSSVSNVKWEITEGFLPAGLTLNSSNGVIEGTPLEPGTFTFTVQASYDSRRGTRQFTLIIYPAEELPDEPKTISSSGGGGCNTGLNSIMLLVSLSLICRRRN